MSEHSAPTRRPEAGGPDGVVLLDKPVGLSSNVALQKVRRIFGARKAGHTGSLDPLASGLLPVCLGQATRFSGYLLDAAKAYRVTARLGERTATGDAEGEVVERCDWTSVDRAALEAVLARFRGPISQVPPMYSALKQGGEPLYRKARRGETVERAPRDVEIYRLVLESWAPPEFSLDVHCSKGTYVRTLVEDIARAAGNCAHVTALRRYAAGPFENNMHTLEDLQGRAEAGTAALEGALLPTDSALAALPALALPAAEADRLRQGQEVELPAGTGDALVRVYDAQGFVGVAERNAAGRLRAKRLMSVSDRPLSCRT
jgi:tRNA pseudouridine55 synthase